MATAGAAAAEPPAPPDAAATAHPDGATGKTRVPPRSLRDPQCGDLLIYLLGRPVVVDVCVTHPRASSAVAAAAWAAGATESKDAMKREMYERTGTGASRFVPLSHETSGRAAPLPVRFSMGLQSLRPRLEWSPRRSSWRMPCAASPQRCVAAWQGRASPRHRCGPALMVGWSSLGGQ